MTESDMLKIIDWATGEDTGTSSTDLVRFMMNLFPNNWGFFIAPSDADDRGRCIRLLNLFPKWWDRLDELAKIDKLWSEQVPLIRKEGGR